MSASTTLPSAPPVSLAPAEYGAPQSFEEMAAMADEHIDVALGAALIARDAHPALDVHAVLAQLDELAAPLRGLSGEKGLAQLSALEQAQRLAHHVYEVLGFKGNEADYYDPKNSLLPDVLRTKLGIPITLALVFVEIARRCGVHARGVGFPGHYLVRIDAGAERVVIDPFFGGRVLDQKALEKLLRRATGPTEPLKDEHVAPASPKTTLVRMLINLKWIYTTRGDLARAHLALDRILTLQPDSVPALRERGMLAARLGAVEAARADLKRLLESHPDLSDAGAIRAKLAELDAKASRSALN
jgi:regulator of sirC expression with transglutaminase-like and TPR domain